jgi:hypothetical protein
MKRKRKNLAPHHRYALFKAEPEPSGVEEARWAIVDAIKLVDPWHRPRMFTWGRTIATRRRGKYWWPTYFRTSWPGRRSLREMYQLAQADFLRTRERAAFALTMPARRAGRVRMKQADSGAPRRKREAESLDSHLSDNGALYDWDYDCDFDFDCVDLTPHPNCDCDLCVSWWYRHLIGQDEPLRVPFLEGVRLR